MADNSVVDDDTGNIITYFLRNTCRVCCTSEYYIEAARFCARTLTEHSRDDENVFYIPEPTGSTAEFYIRPMLSCVGDVDVMIHRSDIMAIPAGSTMPSRLPAEFHSRAKVYEIIDSEYPGYVYLMCSCQLKKNADTAKYDILHDEKRHCIAYNMKHAAQHEIHGPAVTAYDAARPFDAVVCLRCLSWPTQAAIGQHDTETAGGQTQQLFVMLSAMDAM